MGIFLCHCPHHAASVPLILSTQTGLVSPQFHCVFDDRFETVKNEPNDTSLWQQKAHFTKLATDKTNDLLISTPTHTQAPTPHLSPYASEIRPLSCNCLMSPSLKPTTNRARRTLPNHQWPHQLQRTFLKPFPRTLCLPGLLHQITQSILCRPA